MKTDKHGYEAGGRGSYQSQRDCIFQPKVGALSAYLGYAANEFFNPNGVASFPLSMIVCALTQPFQGCALFSHSSQGSSRTRNPGLKDRIPLGFTQSPSATSTIAEPEHCAAPNTSSIRVHKCPFVVKLL